MTFKEAKKILKKEGYELEKVGRPFIPSIAFTAYESPEICEAMQVVCSAGYSISMVSSRFIERKACLKKEYEKSTKAPGEEQPEGSVSGKLKCEAKLIGPLRRLNTETLDEHPKEKKGIIYPTTSPKADFYYKHVLNEGNPALKEAASQFNDALLDEQAKKIEELTKEKTNLEDQITILNAFKELNEKVGRKQIKRLGKEISKLNSIIHDKNAVLSDVAEELRLTKIREKNLVEVSQKYMKENEELKKELADKVVDEINAKALKSADSALAWKEKVVTYKDMALAYYEKKIADLGKELAATKKELEEKTKMVGTDIAEEGADNSGTIVICGKDFVKKFKENEESLSEFLKNIEDEAVESMSIESGHLGGNESFGQMEAAKPSQRFKQAVCDARLELLYFIS